MFMPLLYILDDRTIRSTDTSTSERGFRRVSPAFCRVAAAAVDSRWNATTSSRQTRPVMTGTSSHRKICDEKFPQSPKRTRQTHLAIVFERILYFAGSVCRRRTIALNCLFFASYDLHLNAKCTVIHTFSCDNCVDSCCHIIVISYQNISPKILLASL